MLLPWIVKNANSKPRRTTHHWAQQADAQLCTVSLQGLYAHKTILCQPPSQRGPPEVEFKICTLEMKGTIPSHTCWPSRLEFFCSCLRKLHKYGLGSLWKVFMEGIPPVVPSSLSDNWTYTYNQSTNQYLCFQIPFTFNKKLI